MKFLRRSRLQVLPSRAAYAQWATHYPAEAHNLLMQVEQNAMFDLLPPLENKNVLDLACGTGRWGKVALAQGAAQVMGLDNSLPMLKLGVLENAAQAEMTAIPLKTASLDVILCGLALGHLKSDLMQQAILEMGRVLKMGGLALISDFHPFQAWQGAQRTFTGQDGRTYAVEHYVHTYADYHAAAKAADLRVDGVIEPSHPQVQEGKAPVILALRLLK